MIRFPTIFTWFMFLLALISVASGCADKPRGPEENKAASHLRQIAQAFDLAQYKGGPPKNIEEIKPFLQQLLKDEDPDNVLRSPNDGELYEIMWGANLERQTDMAALVAHEKKGVEGKRFVINVARIVTQMSDADFRSATFAKGRR